MTLFTNGGCETGDLSNWSTVQTATIVETDVATVTATTTAKYYGNYGMYLHAFAGDNGTALAHATQGITLNGDTITFKYKIPLATVSNSARGTRRVYFEVWCEQPDSPYDSFEILSVYYDTETPPATVDWTTVTYTATGKTGYYWFIVKADAEDHEAA